MPNLIKGSQISKEIVTKKVVTKSGEVSLDITLHLDINITSEGIQVSATPLKAQKVDEAEDDISWAVPSFGTEKIEFGKDAE